jgi:hypothetical protein
MKLKYKILFYKLLLIFILTSTILGTYCFFNRKINIIIYVLFLFFQVLWIKHIIAIIRKYNYRIFYYAILVANIKKYFKID